MKRSRLPVLPIIQSVGVWLGVLGWSAPSAHADTVYEVTVSNLTFQAAAGNDSCSGLPCTETFNASFRWDNTTETLVPGTEKVNATGALSPSDVAGPWTIANFVSYPLGLGFPIEEFPGPDYIAIFDTDWVTPISPGVYPYSHASMACYQAPSQCDSLFDFTDANGGVYFPFAIGGGVTISNSVPETASWAMMLIGFAGMAYAGHVRAQKHRLAATTA